MARYELFTNSSKCIYVGWGEITFIFNFRYLKNCYEKSIVIFVKFFILLCTILSYPVKYLYLNLFDLPV